MEASLPAGNEVSSERNVNDVTGSKEEPFYKTRLLAEYLMNSVHDKDALEVGCKHFA